MGKDKERSTACHMYVEQGKTAVEISAVTGITEKTIGVWIKKYGWREQRNAKFASKTSRIENIQAVIDDLVEQRLDLSKQIRKAQEDGDKALVYDLNRQAVALGDELSKYNKTRNDILKGNALTLEEYLEMMQELFDDMRRYDEKLYNSTLDFQEQHVQMISKKLG